jgi:hypothetical protein
VGTILLLHKTAWQQFAGKTTGRVNMIDKVNNNTAEHRFELEAEGHLAAAYYARSGDVVTFEHTEVPAALGGKGVGPCFPLCRALQERVHIAR